MDFDRWLQQPYDDRARASESIRQEIERILMEPEYNPCNVKTFIEGIENGALDDSRAALKSALESPEVGHAALGSVVFNAVYDWCYKQADNEAARRLHEGQIDE